MKFQTNLSIADRHTDRDLRERMKNLRVLIADRDLATAKLMKRILFSFGLRNIDLTTDGVEAMGYLRSLPFDILITEWDMHPLDGLTLVKEIRAAREDKRIRRDIPIIMLTTRADLSTIQSARDAGINEFIVKPFTAKAISNRIIQIIDNPREFVATETYAGPCRRRRGDPPPGVAERRTPRADVQIQPPSFELLGQLGVDSASEIITPEAVEEAQRTLDETTDDSVLWARRELVQLQQSYAMLQRFPTDNGAQRALLDAVQAIRAQALTFNYDFGTQVADLLIAYVGRQGTPSANHLLVIGKHVDAIRVIFSQQIEQTGHNIAEELIYSLSKLITKLE